MDNYVVYCYLDPRKPGIFLFDNFKFDYEPIYIGKGKPNRPQRHLTLYKTNNNRFYSKLQSIIESGLTPEYKIIKSDLTEEKSFEYEKYFIELIGRIGNNGTLTNLTNGGEVSSGFIKTTDTINKLSVSIQKNYSKTLTIRKDDFIEKSIKIHNNKYDYSLVDYKNTYSKVKIICPIHGTFEQGLKPHSNGQGCPSCSGNKKLTNTTFIELSNIRFNNYYNYSDVKYINNRTNVSIICPIHGTFLQTPETHLKSNGCPNCSKHRKKDTEYFITKSNIIHNGYYGYKKSIYTGIFNKLIITCPIHQDFEQSTKNHMSGQGCKQCSINKKKKET